MSEWLMSWVGNFGVGIVWVGKNGMGNVLQPWFSYFEQ